MLNYYSFYIKNQNGSKNIDLFIYF